ncbi:MAG: PilZ domain-containing protein [Oligoflexia bacterium]|nr:PilZ domain-containing protein [Oligoflexia bacterium]
MNVDYDTFPIEKRRHTRFTISGSAFEFEDKLYEIANLSARGILLDLQSRAVAAGGASEIVAKVLDKNKFDFNLVDTSSRSKLPLKGRVVRVIKENERVVALALQFSLLENSQQEGTY